MSAHLREAWRRLAMRDDWYKYERGQGNRPSKVTVHYVRDGKTLCGKRAGGSGWSEARILSPLCRVCERKQFGSESSLHKAAAGKPVWQMTESEFRSIESRLVYHSTTYERDYRQLLTEGVRMANVPNNLARQRYERGEYAEIAPGAGAGRGLYVARPLYHVFGYGRYIVGIEVSQSDLAIPPEQEYHLLYGTVETALNSVDGAMIVRDIPASRVHAVAERYTHEVHDPWALTNDPRWFKPGEQIADQL